MINILCKTEKDFLKALEQDYIENKEFSFLNILFCVDFKRRNNLLLSLLDDLNNKKQEKLFKKSEIIFRTQDSFYLGKYDKHFFVYGNEGDLFGAGLEIQNTCNVFRRLFYSYDSSDGDRRMLDMIFKMNNHPPYDEIIKKYKIFCNTLGLAYTEDDEYWEKQAEEFNDKYAC